MTDQQLPHHVRPVLFASIELALDLIYVGRTIYRVDLESFVILLCVCEATMRPFVLDPDTPESVLHAARPPDTVRGSISRRMVADKTGLPRETVRRKLADLAAQGYVTIDADARIRIGQSLDGSDEQRAIENAHNAVMRYLKRLEQLGIDWRTLFQPRAA